MLLQSECQNVLLRMLVRPRYIVLIVVSLLLIASTAHSQNLGNPPPLPSAPSIAPASYTVSWQHSGDPDTIISRLEEKPAGGQWTTIGSTQSGQSSVNITRTSGTYQYRTTELRRFYWNPYEPDVGQISSAAITVQVNDGPIPEPETVSTQLDYTYQVRQGDINFDGRQDLFIDRTSGGTSGNGTLETIILQRLADSTFTTIIPSVAQSATASSWPVAAVDLLLRDFDLDGFVDIVVDKIAGAAGQIVLSSGQILNNAPKGIVPMDAKFEQFMMEASQWISNPNYYEENVAYVTVTYYQWVPYCYWYWDGYYCSWYLVYWTVNQPDYSVFDPDALDLRNVFTEILDGLLNPEIILGSPEAVIFGEIFERVFGSTILRDILSGPCNTVFAYDDDYDVPCNNTNLFAQILLSSLVGWSTGDGDYRLLTSGEKSDAGGEGLSINNVNLVRVYNRGLRIFFRIDSQIMSPNGHVYIGTENTLLPWSEDYSVESTQDEGVLIHELTHVYQVRNEGCHIVCMGFKKLGSLLGDGYDYYPIDPGKTYHDHNMEQQAEMVMDRFRFREGLRFPLRGDNSGVTQADLESIVPF